MYPTRLQVRTRFNALLDDPLGSIYTDSIFQEAFAEGYDVLFSSMLNDQVPLIDTVVEGLQVPVGTTHMTAIQLGLGDFIDFNWIAERTFGSTDPFTDLVEVDRLTQRPQADRLIEFVWQNNAFKFVGATSIRELRMNYITSGPAPTLDADVIGFNASLNFLANYAVGVAGPRKGDDEIAQRCMQMAVGPKFNLGTIGGELFRLIQPLVRSRQHVQIAPKPYTTQRRLNIRRAIPYVVAQPGTTGGTGGNTMTVVQFTSATGGIVGAIDGVNAAFFLNSAALSSFTLFRNGLLQTVGTDYSVFSTQITFLAGAIPQTGDLLTAEGILS